jgi:hypothetical protein
MREGDRYGERERGTRQARLCVVHQSRLTIDERKVPEFSILVLAVRNLQQHAAWLVCESEER